MKRLLSLASLLIAFVACNATEPGLCPVQPLEVRRDSVARAVPDSLLPQVWVGLCAGPTAQGNATLRVVIRF